MDRILNRDLLPHNTCFGCGLENPAGLHIEVYGDPAVDRELRARFMPSPAMTGFPGITHGGAIYTALDCLSTWVATLLGPNRGAAWVLRSAEIVYRAPALSDAALDLAGRVHEQAGPWEPLVVRGEARRTDGTLCVEGTFKVVPLSTEKFLGITGIERLPENWKAFLAGGA